MYEHTYIYTHLVGDTQTNASTHTNTHTHTHTYTYTYMTIYKFVPTQKYTYDQLHVKNTIRFNELIYTQTYICVCVCEVKIAFIITNKEIM